MTLALTMPNLRRLLTPDPSFTLFEIDLKGADARVVAWEANDAGLKEAFNAGVDIHAHNARSIWPLAPYDKITRELRQRAKTAVHAVNYGCKARTLADHIGTSANEADTFINQWFLLHPGIREWHRRVEAGLRSRGAVSNVWGYRRQYFDRVESLLPKALAWIGQSTTAIAINKLIVSLAHKLPEAQILLQTHDSVTLQIPSLEAVTLLPHLKSICTVSVPYPDPLEMPCDIKCSTKSWGEMHALEELP